MKVERMKALNFNNEVELKEFIDSVEKMSASFFELGPIHELDYLNELFFEEDPQNSLKAWIIMMRKINTMFHMNADKNGNDYAWNLVPYIERYLNLVDALYKNDVNLTYRNEPKFLKIVFNSMSKYLANVILATDFAFVQLYKETFPDSIPALYDSQDPAYSEKQRIAIGVHALFIIDTIHNKKGVGY